MSGGRLSARSPHYYVVRVGIFLIAAALVAGVAVCGPIPGTKTIEIRDWYQLDAIRNSLSDSYLLMNNLDSTTPGYEELASPTANEGKGWQPIGTFFYSSVQQSFGEKFEGTFDGQGYEIRDLYINRPGESSIGLFGFVGKGGIIKNISVMNATVTGSDGVSELVGLNEGTVRSLIGYLPRGADVGGLVGLNEGTVSNCYAMGNVTGDEEVGGLVAGNGGTVSNSYATGSVTGNYSVGGLLGVNSGTVSNSYSTGNVTGNEDVGGLVGSNFGTVSNSFWDVQTSGQTTSAGGTGKTTAEMKSIATFSGAGWNITAVAPNKTNPSYIWNIVDNMTYPFLSWQSQLLIGPFSGQ
jgi:hypothetical protein